MEQVQLNGGKIPAVSVVMPIYKTSRKHLCEAIESVLSQSFRDFEFIILNDSPCDAGLKDVVSAYRDERIVYVENEQTKGVAKSYNRLLDLARAPLIAMMNHDDIALENRLLKQVTYMREHPEIGLVGTGYKKFGETKRFGFVVNPKEDEDIRTMILFKSPVHHPTMMFRKEVAVRNNIRYNEEFVSLNDRQFYFDMSAYTKLGNIGEVLYKYRFHKDMVSKKMKPLVFEEQKTFHERWFERAGIVLSREEKEVFDNYAALGRCRIRDANTLKQVAGVLIKIGRENEKNTFVPVERFNEVLGKYLAKRCLNAAVYGGVNSAEILKESGFAPKSCFLLNILNLVLYFKGQR